MMPEKQEQKGQQTTMPKVVSVKDDVFYSNCTMIETSPFDVSILFGRVKRRADDKGQQTLVEVYDKQVYLSHLQAKALHEALGRSLQALSQQQGDIADAQRRPTQQ